MKVLLLAGGMMLSLTNCDSNLSTKAAGTAAQPHPVAGRPLQHLPAPVLSAPRLAQPTTVSPTPAAVDTVALLCRAVERRLPGAVVDRFVVGDLNRDHWPDFLVVCRSQQVNRRNPAVTPSSEEGYLAIVLNQQWPQLHLAALDQLGCLGTGCSFRDAKINGPYFTVERLEGDCEKTYTVDTYRYSSATHTWLLYKIGERLYSMCSYNSGEVEYHERTRRDFGRVVFGQSSPGSSGTEESE